MIVGFGETRTHAENGNLRAAGERGRRPAPPGISSRSAATPSSSKASRSGAILIAWCGVSMQDLCEFGGFLPVCGSLDREAPFAA
jgi:hypothetical protein